MLKAIFEPYYIDIFHKFGEVTSKIPAGTILMKDTTNAEYVKVSNGTDFWGVLSQDLYPDPGSEYIKPYNDHRAYSGDQVGIYHKGMFETDQFVVSYEVDDEVDAEGSVVVGEVEVSITGEADEAYHNVKVVFEGGGSSDATAAWNEGVLTITLQDAETYAKTDIDTLITGATGTAPEGVTTLTVDFEGGLTGEELAGAEIVLKCVFVEIPYVPGADLYVTSKGKFTNTLEEGEAATETSGKVKVGKIVKKEGNKLTVKLG